MRGTGILVAMAATALLAGGCTATTRMPPSGADAFPPTDQVRTLSLPFDAYSPSVATIYLISNAQDRLTRDCMTAAGLDWKMIARPTTVSDYRNRRRYGVIEPAIAARYGHHAPAGLLASAIVDQSYDARDHSLSQAQKDAAYGPVGCATKAAGRIPVNPNADPGRLTEFDRTSLNDARRDPAVATALTAWHDCMSRQGLHYEDPFEAISDPRWWTDAAADPSGDEKQAAVADVRCKGETGLVDAWHTAEVPIQNDLIHRNASYFQTLKANLDREVAEANVVLTR